MSGLLSAANLGGFAGERWLGIGGGEHRRASFVLEPALAAQRLIGHPGDGQPWLPVLTHLFLHGGAAAGAPVAVDPGSALPTLGASGAISGVLGAALILFPPAWGWALGPGIVPVLPVPAAVFLVRWFAFQRWGGRGARAAGSAGGVAWWAPAGGFAAGAALVGWAQGAGGGGRREPRGGPG